MNPKRDKILEFISTKGGSTSSEIHAMAGAFMSYATVKRILAGLVDDQLITRQGQGRATRYVLSVAYDLFRWIDPDAYFDIEVDERDIRPSFNFTLMRDVLRHTQLFTEQEQKMIEQLQQQFKRNAEEISPTAYKKEMERLAIDLSWKSSQIEGNTYSLLETEQLLKEKRTAAGKTKEEAVMLLNHKDAIDFIVENPDYLMPLSISRIEDIHTMLTRELDVERNIRTRRVGISGTNYRPIDNDFQIREALSELCDLINQKVCVFEKALLALAMISYIQPFTDGNKRTARIVSNAILIHFNHCPISFRTVDSIDYKKAVLLFYEQNNLRMLKNIFIEQFAFAVNTYF